MSARTIKVVPKAPHVRTTAPVQCDVVDADTNEKLADLVFTLRGGRNGMSVEYDLQPVAPDREPAQKLILEVVRIFPKELYAHHDGSWE